MLVNSVSNGLNKQVALSGEKKIAPENPQQALHINKKTLAIVSAAAAAAALGIIAVVSKKPIKLKSIKFENGIAKLHGKNFTGTICDNLKSGKNAVLQYKDGVIQHSTITAKNGEKKLLTFIEGAKGQSIRKSKTLFKPNGKDIVSTVFNNKGNKESVLVLTKKDGETFREILTRFNKDGKKYKTVTSNFKIDAYKDNGFPFKHEFFDKNGKLSAVIKQNGYDSMVDSVVHYAPNGKTVKSTVKPDMLNFSTRTNKVYDKMLDRTYRLNDGHVITSVYGENGSNRLANTLRSFIGNFRGAEGDILGIQKDGIKDIILNNLYI